MIKGGIKILGNFFSADNRKINYTGRIDFSDSKKPILIYAGSFLCFKFTGNHLAISLSSISFEQDIWIGYILDGKEHTILLKADNYTEIIKTDSVLPQFNRKTKLVKHEIPVETDYGTHTFTLFKRMDGTHIMTFEGLYLDEKENLTDQPPLPSRKLEFYGDSVCCGSVCEASEYTGIVDPPDHNCQYDNAWQSFPMITGRLLNARVHNVSQGGLALLNGSGYCFGPVFPGLETIYSQLQYISYLPVSEWNFSDYCPNVVIIAIGQNDPHSEGNPDRSINDSAFRIIWKNTYKKIICSLMDKYPNAVFILTTTTLSHDENWDIAIDEIISEMKSSKIFRNRFKRNGKATQGHPRICEQEEMAAELAQFIISLGDRIWDE